MDKQSSNINELELIAKVQLSGSLIAKSRDTLAFQADTNSKTEGFIFAPQKKETYNIDELKKAIDVEVVELIPPDPEEQVDLVPRPLYEEALESLALAEETIDIQSATIGTLEGTVSDLQSQIDDLKEEVDNEKLLRVLAEENFDNARQEIAVIIQESQLSYQRSILEGISKTSLEARNEGLIAQVELLKEEVASLQSEIDRQTSIIQGKEAEIEAGAKAGKDISILVKTKNDSEASDLTFRRQKRNFLVNAFDRWINGPETEVYNFTSETISIEITQTGYGWLKLGDKLIKTNPVTIILNPNERRELNFSAADTGNVTQDQERRGTVKFVTKNGTTTITTAIQRQFGFSWSNNPKILYS